MRDIQDARHMNPTVADVLLSSAFGIAGSVLASWLTISVLRTRKRVAALVAVTFGLVVGLVAVKTTAASSPAPAAPDRPLVSVADLVAAAKLDTDLPQGKGTPGSTASVERFENALAVLGLLNRKWVDGSYGFETIAAVKHFQASIGDRADGVPGILELKSIATRSGTFTAVP